MPLPLARQTLAPQHSRPASTRKTKQYGPHIPQTESRDKDKPTRNFHQEAASSKTQESCGEKNGVLLLNITASPVDRDFPKRPYEGSPLTGRDREKVKEAGSTNPNFTPTTSALQRDRAELPTPTLWFQDHHGHDPCPSHSPRT